MRVTQSQAKNILHACASHNLLPLGALANHMLFPVLRIDLRWSSALRSTLDISRFLCVGLQPTNDVASGGAVPVTQLLFLILGFWPQRSCLDA